MKNLWLFHEKRIAILRELARCDRTRGCDIKDCLRMKKALLSYHLGILRDRGIVAERRDGREKYYGIRPQRRRLVNEILRVVG